MNESPAYDITIREGEDFLLPLALVEDDLPMNLTGASFEGAIRAGFADSDPVLTSFTISVPVPANGELFLALSKANAAALSVLNDPYSLKRPGGVYDVFMTQNGSRRYLMGGRVRYQPTVTPWS